MNIYYHVRKNIKNQCNTYKFKMITLFKAIF